MQSGSITLTLVTFAFVQNLILQWLLRHLKGLKSKLEICFEFISEIKLYHNISHTIPCIIYILQFDFQHTKELQRKYQEICFRCTSQLFSFKYLQCTFLIFSRHHHPRPLVINNLLLWYNKTFSKHFFWDWFFFRGIYLQISKKIRVGIQRCGPL